MPRILYVSGFHHSTRARDLAVEFERFGRLVRCDIPVLRSGHTTSPYAFVEFKNEEDAEEAYHRVHGKVFDDRRLSIQWAKNPPTPSWRIERPKSPPPAPSRSSRDRSPPSRRRSMSPPPRRNVDERTTERDRDRERDRDLERRRERVKERFSPTRDRDHSRERHLERHRDRESDRGRDDRKQRDRSIDRERDYHRSSRKDSGYGTRSPGRDREGLRESRQKDHAPRHRSRSPVVWMDNSRQDTRRSPVRDLAVTPPRY